MHHLRFVPITSELRDLQCRSHDAFEQYLGARLHDMAATIADLFEQSLAHLARHPRSDPWGGYLAIDDSLGNIVGTCAFKHGPDAKREIEIAYFTFPGFERIGYATAMARNLVEMSRGSDMVATVIAHTLPRRNASCRVLEKAGFAFEGETIDPEDGKVWRWAHAMS